MKKLILSLLLLSSLFISTSSFSLFELVQLPKTNGAMCMDGSNYGIYTFTP
jgi:hypothetical protein